VVTARLHYLVVNRSLANTEQQWLETWFVPDLQDQAKGVGYRVSLEKPLRQDELDALNSALHKLCEGINKQLK